LRPTLGTVRDQGFRPTCLSQAVTASHEQARGSSVRLSAEYLHYFATAGQPLRGSTMSGAGNALEHHGQPYENRCPDFASDPPARWMPTGSPPVFRRRSATISPSLKRVEEAIRATRAPVLGISLPQTFFYPRKPWAIPPGSPILGLHAVVGAGLGFHKQELAILIRNSWGVGWGDRGHALLRAQFLRRHLVDVMLLAEEEFR
jgi:hypothetical protein